MVLSGVINIATADNRNQLVEVMTCQWTAPRTCKPLSNARFDEEKKVLHIQGSLSLMEKHRISATELSVTYWPVRHSELKFAQIVVRDDKFDSEEIIKWLARS